MSAMRVWRAWGLVLLAGVAAAGDPQRIQVDTPEGEKAIYYQYGGRRYLALEAAELARAPLDVDVAYGGNVYDVQGDRVVFSGIPADTVFRLSPAALAVGIAPGANWWVGGRIASTGRERVFRVEQAAPLPGDWQLFAGRMREAEEAGDGESFYRVAWWLARAERAAGALPARELERYRTGMQDAYRRGLALDTGLATTAEGQARLAARLQRFVDGGRDLILEGDADWYFGVARTALARRQAAGAGSEGEKAGTAALFALLGRQYIRFLGDKKEAGTWFFRAAELDPKMPGLEVELKSFGYSFVDGAWVTPEEAVSRQRAREEAMRREYLEREVTAARDAMRRGRAAWARGDLVSQPRTVVEPLLSPPSAENLQALGLELPNLGEEAARYAVWMVADLPKEADPLSVISAALRSSNAAVRQDAADALMARRDAEGLRILLWHLSGEKDEGVRDHVLSGLAMVPGAWGLEALTAVLGWSSLSDAVREKAGQTLARVADGPDFGTNAQLWKAWIEENHNLLAAPRRPFAGTDGE